MLHLNEIGVELFIKKFKSVTKEAYWENYDLVIWNKDYSGFTNKKGVFRQNVWGIADRISVSNKGTWVLPKKYVKYFK
jgi:hypothetical protein